MACHKDLRVDSPKLSWQSEHGLYAHLLRKFSTIPSAPKVAQSSMVESCHMLAIPLVRDPKRKIPKS